MEAFAKISNDIFKAEPESYKSVALLIDKVLEHASDCQSCSAKLCAFAELFFAKNRLLAAKYTKLYQKHAVSRREDVTPRDYRREVQNCCVE